MTLPRSLRITLIAVVAVIVLAAGTGAILLSRFDPNSLKPKIIEAVKRSTGRDLALNGKIGLKLSFWPTIRVKDVAFSNPPGFSRAQMATLGSMEVQLAVLPLLSNQFQIDRMVLIHPDILLETAASGQTNWQMTPEASQAAPAGPPTGAEPAARSDKPAASVRIDTIRIQDGTIAYRDDTIGTVTSLALPKLQASSSTPDSPLHLDADATYNGTSFTLTADTGSLARLQDTGATTPWAVNLTVTAAGAKLTADGSMTQPLKGKGYDLAVTGTVPDASALIPLLRGYVPPPLHDVSFAAKVADSSGKLPEFSTLTLHVGQSDLGTWMPGVSVEKLDIDAPKVDQAMKIAVTARLDEAPVTIAGTFGPPALLLPDAKPGTFPVDLTIQAAGASAAAKGSIADARGMTGVNIGLTARIPDLSALSPLARQPLPALKDVAFVGTLADGGSPHAVSLRGLKLSGPAGDVSGDATIGFGPRKSLTASLTSSHIDLDVVQAAIGQTTNAPPVPAPDARPRAEPRRRGEPLFASQPIPFSLLRAFDADLQLTIATLRSGGDDTKAIGAHAVLANGKLTIDPFAADLPGGHLSGSLSADTTLTPPPVHLVLHAPGLSLKTILAFIHQPAYGTGNVEVYADLSGTGDTPHALAASIDGSLGLAMAGGTIDNRLLGSLLGKIMDSLNALDLVSRGGSSSVKCFGMRMDARNGIGAIKALALSSSLLTMTGAGTVNFGNETVAMALRPRARVAGTGLVIPVAVSGPIRDPVVKVNDLGAAEANAGTVAGAVIGGVTGLGIVGGLLGGDKLFSGGASDICPPALAAARGQAVPDSAPAKTEQPGVSNPEAFLKNLFR
jgi:AsmA protein